MLFVESVENLINVFWVIFSVFEIGNFKKFACISINGCLKDLQKIQASNLGSLVKID